MKILFLTNIPSPYRVSFFNTIGKNTELTVLYERKKAEDREDSWFESEAKYFKEVYLKGKNFGNDSALCLDVVNWINKEHYNIIVIGSYSTPTAMLAISYMKLKKIRFILNSDGGFIKSDNVIKYAIKKFFISSASYWLSTGEETTKYQIHYGAKKDKISIYPFSSVQREDIVKLSTKEQKQDIKNELGIRYKKNVISVGQFIYRKGFDILLRACYQLQDSVGVYIIGGSITNELAALKNTLNLDNVHFLEFKTKKELFNYFSASDIFVLPTREDIWGLVINEAMANGLPIITTNKCIAGLELLKQDENGYIVETENETELAEKMKFLLYNDELRESMSNLNIKKIHDYTIEEMAMKHLDIFKNYLELYDLNK